MKAGDLVADRYRLLRTIGEGGMGSVWAAHHELIGRDVAIKVTGEKVSKRREIRERFLNEARAVGKVRHANVIDVMDVGQLPDERLYIVFELLDGRTLEEHLAKKGRLPAGDAAMILVEVCRGLEAAHGAGIVHRDLKPANIFLHRTGGAIGIKLLDFGISKTIDEEGVSLSVTQTGVVMGTPQYMSVEQARGRDDIDLRADIWSAGTILYELTTGRVAFDAANYNAVLDKIMHEDALPLLSSGVNEPGLQAVVSRCLSKQRNQRYRSAKELREALEALLPSLPVGAGGLKLPGLVSAAVDSYPDSAPTRPEEDSPQIRAARHEPTLLAPESNPPTPIRGATPIGTPIRSPASKAPSNDSPPTPNQLPTRPSTLAVRNRRLAATIGAIAIAAAIVIALSISASSKSAATVIASPAPPPREDATAAPVPLPTPEVRAVERPPMESPPSRVEPQRSAAAAPSARKPSSRPNPMGPKPRSVTKVDSAGF